MVSGKMKYNDCKYGEYIIERFSIQPYTANLRTILSKTNPRQILRMEFYELIPESSGILQCKTQQLCSLVMISMPDYSVSLFKGCVTDQQQTSTSSS